MRLPQNTNQHRRISGFSLIELMIVVVVIGILAAVVYPSYQQYAIKTKRTDAQAMLSSFAQSMERHFLQNSTYTSAITGSAPAAPDIFPSQSPESGTAAYNLTVQAVTANSFTLRATPVGAQVGDGYVELVSTGAKRWDKNNDGDTNDSGESCWNDNC